VKRPTISESETGEPAGKRGRGERADSGDEEAAMPEQVAEPSTEQQEAAVREQIPVDDPREGGLREAEILANRGQRDADDRDVKHDHQARQAQDIEGKPACARVRGITHAVGLLRIHDHVP
jgi:hypothetical protein